MLGFLGPFILAVVAADRAATVEEHVQILGEPGEHPAGGNIKELNYGSMDALGKELQSTVQDMNKKIAGELTQKANTAVKEGQNYAKLLKEQEAGHKDFEGSVKHFRNALSVQHHENTKQVKDALGTATQGGGDEGDEKGVETEKRAEEEEETPKESNTEE